MGRRGKAPAYKANVRLNSLVLPGWARYPRGMIRILPSLILASALLLVACGGSPPPPPMQMPPPPVGVASPIAKDLPVLSEVTGRIESPQVIALRPQVGGAITQVLVADGASVTAGQLLFTLDAAPWQAIVVRSEAEIARAEARSNQAKLQFERAKKLVADQVVSPQVFEDAESALRIAEADVAATRAALVSARIDLEHTRISAPSAGRIGQVQAVAGNLAQANGPAAGTLLAVLNSVDPVDVAFDLDEAVWAKLGEQLRLASDAVGAAAHAQPGAVERARARAFPVRVALSSESGFPHIGSVRFVDHKIDPATGTIRVRATLPNPGGKLTPGAFARVQIELEPPRPVLLVNERAVLAQLATRYVLTVDDKGVTAFRPVQLGVSIDGLRLVVGGLGPTDRIAVNNLSKIFFPGMPVTPVPADMQTLANFPPPSATATGAGSTGPAGSATAAADEKAKP